MGYHDEDFINIQSNFEETLEEDSMKAEYSMPFNKKMDFKTELANASQYFHRALTTSDEEMLHDFFIQWLDQKDSDAFDSYCEDKLNLGQVVILCFNLVIIIVTFLYLWKRKHQRKWEIKNGNT